LKCSKINEKYSDLSDQKHSNQIVEKIIKLSEKNEISNGVNNRGTSKTNQKNLLDDKEEENE